MKTYDELTKKEKDKLNTYLLHELHYTILNSCLAICIYMLGSVSILLITITILFDNISFALYAMMLVGTILLLFVVMRVSNNKNKEQCKRRFGIEKVGRDVFKE